MTVVAGDIMTTPAISVNKNCTLKDVAELLAKYNFSGVPVTGDDGKIIGILSETDIVKYSNQVNVIPFSNLSRWISPYTEIDDIAVLRKGIDLLSRTKVAAVMSKKVFSLTRDTPVLEIAQIMSRRNINRIPIVDNEKKLVGIITRGDLIKHMAGN